MGKGYTEKQREALKKYYPDGNYEALSKRLPGKTRQQIITVANKMGLKRTHPGYLIDRTGQQYGQLTVLGFDHIDKGKQNTAYWKCRCSCGKECIVASNYVPNMTERIFPDMGHCQFLHEHPEAYAKLLNRFMSNNT